MQTKRYCFYFRFRFKGPLKLWHSNTYRLDNTLNYGLERVWTICCLKGSNNVAIGYDEGSVMIKVCCCCKFKIRNDIDYLFAPEKMDLHPVIDLL